jgi:polysaccharide biosynthesis/export protein
MARLERQVGVMKKILTLFLLLFVAGCTIPGNYISSSYSVSSSHTNLAGRLLNTTVISIDNKFLYSSNATVLTAPYKYHIGPYDVLNVVVWNHPELTAATTTSVVATNALTNTTSLNQSGAQFSQVTSQPIGVFVDSDGEIVFPLLGPVKVANLTTNQISALLTKKLTKYIRNPRISVQVTAFNSQRAHVLGEVVQPGMRPLTDRPLTILDALSLSGGINVTTADVSNIYIIRSVDLQNISVYRLNTRSPQNLLIAEQFCLANNDIIYVPPAGVVSWNRVINQILPSLETIWYTRSLVRD